MRSNIKRNIFIVSVLLIITFKNSLAAPVKVSFVSPSPQSNLFWGETIYFMKAASIQLNIDLKILYSQDNRFDTISMLRKEILSKEPPDYLMYIFVAGIDDKILALAEQKGIKSFIFNTDILENKKNLVGKPREKFKKWIGHIFPDDEKEGYDLTEKLINEAYTHKEGLIEVCALTGSRDASSSINRKNGLIKAVNKANGVVLNQCIFTDWSRKDSEYKAFKLLERYPNTSVFWCANDEIAMGVIKAVKRFGKIPGKDIFIGGADWSNEALNAVKNGEMLCTYGKHFMEGGIALILIHDYHLGLDFKDYGTKRKTKFSMLDKGNVGKYLSVFGDKNWSKIDFRKFSRKYNRKTYKYNFTLDNFFKNIKSGK